MARVVGGVGISHTPSMGHEYDKAQRGDGRFSARWQPWYDGTRRVGELLDEMRPDHAVVVYNDHLSHFTLDDYPTLALGVGRSFHQADEGWGLRDVDDIPGDLEWGLHLSEFLVENEFGITVSQELAVDHGIFSWFPYLVPSAWDLTITPLAVNMMRAPLPTHQRLRHLGEALRAGVEAFEADQRVVVIATGGMSHQIGGARFGIANADFDRWFLRSLPDHLDDLVDLPREEYTRLGVTAAAELFIWFAMRAALTRQATAAYSFDTFPEITGCGALVMTEPGAPAPAPR